MNIDDLPFLMALFWYGFSTTYIVLVWFQRLRPQWDTNAPNDQASAVSPVPYFLRLTLSLLGISGAMGAAALVASFRHQVVGADWVFLVGFAVGIALAYRLHMRTLAKGEAST